MASLRLLLALLLLVFCPGLMAQPAEPAFLSPAERQWLAQSPNFKVGVMQDWPPFSFAQGTSQVGVSMDFFNEVNRLLQGKLTPHPAPWKENYEQTQKGDLAAIMDITPHVDREPYFWFTQPYLSIAHVIIGRKGGALLQQEAQLAGKTLALEKGFYNIKYFQQKDPSIQIKTYNNTAAALEAVARGEADAYAGNRAVAVYLIERELMTNLEVQGELNKERVKLAFGVHKSLPQLHQILEKALAQIPEADRRKIRSRWVSVEPHRQSLQLLPAEKTWLAAHPLIRVGINPDFAPYSFVDEAGQAQGAVVDFLRLAGQRLGLRFEMHKDLPWAEVQTALAQQKLDLVPGLPHSPETAPAFHLTKGYLATPWVLVSQKAPAAGPLHLAGKRVALIQGDLGSQIFFKQHPDLAPLWLASPAETLQAVSQGKAEFALGLAGASQHLAQRLGLGNLKLLPLENAPNWSLAMAVRQDWAPLASLLQKALDSLSEAEKTAILHKWLQRIDPEEVELQLTPQEKAWLAQHPQIRLGVDIAWPPFEFVDHQGHYQGIASGFVRAMAKKLHLKMVPATDLTWQEVIKKAQAKELDLLPALQKSPERSKFLNFTDPYVSFPMVIAAAKNIGLVSGVGDLRGHKVGVVAGYFTQEVLQRDFPEIQLEAFASVQAGLMALKAGQIDAFIDNLAVINYEIYAKGLQGINIVAPTTYNFELSLGVRKDWPELVPILNKYLRSLSEEEKKALINSWISVQYQFGYDLKTIALWVAPALVLVGLFFGVILAANRRLSREMQAKEAAQLALATSQNQLQAILDYSPTAIYLKDRTGGYLVVNQHWCNLFQIDQLLATGNQDQALFPGPRAEENLARLAKVLETGQAQEWEESLTTQGETKHLLFLEFPLIDAKGAIHAVGGIGMDITHAKESTQKINTLYQRLQQAQTMARLGSWEYNHQNGDLWISAAAYHLLERQPQKTEANFRQLVQFASEEEANHFFAAYNQAIDQGQGFSVETQILSQQGERLILHVKGEVEKDQNGQLLTIKGTLQDITSRVKFQQELVEAKQNLEEANRRLLELDKLKSMFIASMSHELRTPLNSIIGFSSVLLSQMAGPLNEKQTDQLGRVHRSAKHLLNLIIEVIDISKIEAGRIEVYPQQVALDELVQEVMESLEQQASRKGLGFSLRGDKGIQLVTDRKRLLQALLNLASNGIKYTETGEVEIIVQDRGEEFSLEVRDTGIGIRPEDFAKLYQAFERFESHLKIKAGGTGLGLYLTRRIAEDLLQGKIQMESELGKGSRFILQLPKLLQKDG